MGAAIAPLQPVLGLLTVLLLPGLPWTYALLGRARISWLERVAVSVGLSVAAVPLGLFLLNVLLGVPMGFLTVFSLALGLVLAGAAVAVARADRPILLAPRAASDSARQWLLLGVAMGLAFYMGMIPRLHYQYPLHQDEWTHLAEASAITEGGGIPEQDPVTGEARPAPHPEVGYHLFLAEVRLLTGLPWQTIFRYLPSTVFALTALCAYAFGRRWGFGFEAALFVTLVPTTVRFLGPAFAVPMALGLLFLPLVLFLVSHLWGLRALPALLLVLLGFLYIAHPPSALFISLVVVVHGLFQTVRPAVYRGGARKRALVHLGAVLGAVALSSLPFFILNSDVVAQAEEARLPPELLTVPGGMIPRLGYIPFLLFIPGMVFLALKGGRAGRALVVETAVVAAVVFTYYVYGVGWEVIYSRGLLFLILLVLLLAGLATWRIRRWLAALLRPRWPRGASIAAAVAVVVALMAPSLWLALGSRHGERYYRVVDASEYQDFLWIRDNLCLEGFALVDPTLGRAFAAVTGRQVYAALPLSPAPVRWPEVEEVRRILQEGVVDADWLRERGVSLVYMERPARSPELVQLRERVYVLPPVEVCGPERPQAVSSGALY